MPPKGATKNKIVSNKGGAKSPAKSAMAKKVKSTSAKKIAKLTARKPAKKTAAPAPAPAEIETVPAVVVVAAPAETKPVKPSKKVATNKPAPAKPTVSKKSTRTRPSRSKVVATKADPAPDHGVMSTVLGAAAAFLSGLKRRLSTA